MLGKPLALLLFVIGLGRSTAFTASPVLQTQQQCSTALFGGDMGYAADGSYDDGSYDDGSGYQNNNDLLLIRDFLQQYYPGFYSILDMNEEVWKAIGETKDGTEVGFTIFAPTNEALQSLGADKEAQLFDERNTETTQKIAAYHVIGEPVTAEALFNSGGVVTCGGEVPIERSISGGIFGIGGQEDGGVTLNGAKVLQTATVGNGIVHEVDTLVSPSILWRYMDQLRIPGST
mmetsp:Transcript_19721/g.49048  ORF Transcript_19721/g.49048 Transcript_19721/m.49048 type:complete len:232 (-) Transcript_19721:1676-2371(-)